MQFVVDLICWPLTPLDRHWPHYMETRQLRIINAPKYGVVTFITQNILMITLALFIIVFAYSLLRAVEAHKLSLVEPVKKRTIKIN